MLKRIMLAGVVVTTFLSAMDVPVKHSCDKKCYELIRDRIDEEILGVSKDAWFRPMVATVKGDVLWAGGADPVQQLIAMEGKIPHQCRNSGGFSQLWNKHMHFKVALERVVTGVAVEQFKSASSRNIVQLLDPHTRPIHVGLSPEIHEFIKGKAIMPYLRAVVSDFNWNVSYMQFGSAREDIHYVQLQGKEINLVEKIELAYGMDENYYLRGTKKQGEQLFWSLNDGKECDAFSDKFVSEKRCWRDSYIEFGNMLIVLGAGGATTGTSTIMQNLINPHIVVFLKPEFLSCLCQHLFKKSKKDSDKEGLVALQKFVNEQKNLYRAMSFPKTNLLRIIQQELLNFD